MKRLCYRILVCIVLLTFSSCHLDYFCKKVQRDKNIDHKWVERTPNSDLLRDYLLVNQAQLYHVKIRLCCVVLC